jgi:hypothetical protein
MVVLLGVFAGLDLLDGDARERSRRRIRPGDDPFLVATTRWDGQHYFEIALEGYSYDPDRSSVVAFFPVYPMLIAGVFRATGMAVEWAGLLVAQLLTAYAAQRCPRASPQLAGWAVLAFGLFPTTLFLRMSYSESTFVLLAVLAMLGVQRRWRPVVVAVIVGLATATRPVGVALLPPLWLYVWGRSESRWKAIGRITCLTPLATWGLLAYMAFQYAQFGEPLAFARTQTHWRSRADVSWGEKAMALAAWEPIWSAYMPSSPGYAGRYAREVPAWFNLQMANPIFFVATAGLVGLGAAKRWLSGAEVLLAAGLLSITYVTRGFDMCMASQGRFAAVVFPVYLVLGRLLCGAPLVVSAGILGLSAVYLAVYAALFAAGHTTI